MSSKSKKIVTQIFVSFKKPLPLNTFDDEFQRKVLGEFSEINVYMKNSEVVGIEAIDKLGEDEIEIKINKKYLVASSTLDEKKLDAIIKRIIKDMFKELKRDEKEDIKEKEKIKVVEIKTKITPSEFITDNFKKMIETKIAAPRDKRVRYLTISLGMEEKGKKKKSKGMREAIVITENSVIVYGSDETIKNIEKVFNT